MSHQVATRIMETTSVDVCNQYLRFGWKLIGQHPVPKDEGAGTEINYVLAFFRGLSDTRRLAWCDDVALANQYLARGWKLIDQCVIGAVPAERRQETIRFVLAWQSEEPPDYPAGEGPAGEGPAGEGEVAPRMTEQDVPEIEV